MLLLTGFPKAARHQKNQLIVLSVQLQ